ncbi:MAG: hypothetical protein HZA89_16080 [Verrucomicrobia bacterium]|nr:hypothetical protein [Verrucomicrobiota bacterium]
MWKRALIFILCGFALAAPAGELPLPPRPADAPTGSEFVRRITGLDLAEREREILSQVTQGNVPDFWRRFVEVKVTRTVEGRVLTTAYFVSPDYLAIGANDDFFLTPVTPATAQIVADKLDCVLPTRRMVDDIFTAATVKLPPAPIPPSPAMTTVPVFQQHNETIRQQRNNYLPAPPPGALVAGHKKDMLTPRLADAPGKVAIYGWHKPDGKPIQPLHLGHAAGYVDYSHGARFIQRNLTVNGEPTTVDAVLADQKLCVLLSDEGPLANPRYAAVTNQFNEREVTLQFTPGVRVVINSPATTDTNKPVRLVLYALPNGNTIEQTIGRQVRPGDDWHFNIQHIGAQTRWLRAHTTDAELVIAYLECTEKSWPAWWRKNDPDGRRIAEIIAALRGRFAGRELRLVLTGHSGGGSFTFGFLDSAGGIPDDVERIAFLDSNYGYDAARGHGGKLAQWLGASTNHFLAVLAYHDSVALLNGKTFVSESGGTWGRSQAMLADLAEKFPFTREMKDELQQHTALGGRVQFFLKENPQRAVLHTVQVELNGFIHALASGTALENRGYRYLGPRAYEPWIAPAP